VIPLLSRLRLPDGRTKGWEEQAGALPYVCFSAQIANVRGERKILARNGLVLIEISGIGKTANADILRNQAGSLPWTLMTFVGADNHSVKIICRGRRAEDEGRIADDEFLAALYRMASTTYTGQLGIGVTNLRPQADFRCFASHDPGIIWRPEAIPFVIRKQTKTGKTMMVEENSARESPLPDRDEYSTQRIVYQFNLAKALEESCDVQKRERTHIILTRLAGHCAATGLPMGMAFRLAMHNSDLNGDPLLVEKVFETAYHGRNMEEYLHRHPEARLSNIPKEALLMMKTESFLHANYELRKNLMTGVVQYRRRNGLDFSYQDLTDDVRNTMTMKALRAGVPSWDKDVNRYINSSSIPEYDPIEDYLCHLPAWDGKDRVEAMARRVPTDFEAWPRLFGIWLRSVVAHWQGVADFTGNSLVPLLIGGQGCGKSSFCSIILPEILKIYYNDRINFKNENDLNIGLTSFALINIDEFDSVRKSQQPLLKYLISTKDMAFRPPYGKTYRHFRKYASFIATTNEPHPLTDKSGSRRFVCVRVTGPIDFLTPVNYPQLYAQVKEEVAAGKRYFLDEADTRMLMEHNGEFY